MPKQKFRNAVPDAPQLDPDHRAYETRDAERTRDTEERFKWVPKGRHKFEMEGDRQREADQQIRDLRSRY